MSIAPCIIKRTSPLGSGVATSERRKIFGETNPRSGWQHKAWGGAKRNPRTGRIKRNKPAERAADESLRLALSPAPRANIILGS